MTLLGGELFGDKTTSWFDIWSIEHLFSGFGLSSLARRLIDPEHRSIPSKRMRSIALVTLVLALAWECIEHYIEEGVTTSDQITYWFQGVEFWGNRLLTDPFIVVLGAILAQRYQHLSAIGKLFSACWLAVHLFLLPNSMSLQEALSDMSAHANAAPFL